jgi:stress response protein YsnF
MLWSVSNLTGYGVQATDGAIGDVRDVLFEDTTSTVRYLVVDTGTWLSGRRVLISPAAIGRPDPAGRLIPVALTKRQVEDSPDVDTDKPVSRQQEDALHGHYGWAPYWGAPTAPGLGPYYAVPPLAAGAPPYWGTPAATAEGSGETPTEREAAEAGRQQGDPHLRSASEVIGYYIEATDGEIGHVEELLAEDGSWVIRYVVVDTKNWWPGKKVLVSPRWMERVDWADQRVWINLTRDEIRHSPEYDPASEVDRAYEERLHRYYGRTAYW